MSKNSVFKTSRPLRTGVILVAMTAAVAMVGDPANNGTHAGDVVSPTEEKHGGEAAKHQTFQEMIAARPVPDLTKLVERSSPDNRTPDAMESFLDLLKLREKPDPKASSVLEQVLIENGTSTRIHRFAAAQALFAIGTPKAHEVLKRYLLVEDAHAELAIGYTAYWQMKEPLRSQFIDLYLLSDVPNGLSAELKQVPAANFSGTRFNLVVILKNESKQGIQFLDPQDFPGRLLHLRDAEGQFVPGDSLRTNCKPKNDLISLQPGQSHVVEMTVEILDGKSPASRYRNPGASLTVQVVQSGHCFEINPARFEFVAMFEVSPIEDEARRPLKLDETSKWWSARTISKPLKVKLAIP